jgi:dipeptidase D
VQAVAAAPPDDAWTAEASAHLLDLLVAVPTGPIAMSPDFPGAVETSTSLGEVTTEGDVLVLHSLSRSFLDAALAEVIAGLEAIARLAGATIEVRRNYGGWRPAPASPALGAARAVYRRLFDAEPQITAMHAGLEPAIIGERVPGMDMLAIGPRVEAPHSPAERLHIASVERFWRLLAGLLDELSAAGGPAHGTNGTRGPTA